MTAIEDAEAATADHQPLVNELLRFKTFAELRDSAFYQAHRSAFAQLLGEPRVYHAATATPRLAAFLRVVMWNIERGTHLDAISDILNHHPVIGHADLMLLNELDDGMVRSGNRNVALELSRRLQSHAIYGVEYLELTKGAGNELRLPGANTAALHGNAILTRHAFAAPQVVQLPRCENNFESAERRLGGRIGILTDLEVGGVRFTAATTHLDVVNTPRCRARQMRAMLEALDARIAARGLSRRAIIGGDLNTHTFARGTRLRAMKNTALILGSRPRKLAQRLARPIRREPAIGEFARFGYTIADCNDAQATARSVVSRLDDSRSLPPPLRWWIKRRVGPEGLTLHPRLDWLAARGLRALRAGEVVDPATGVASIDPQTFSGLTDRGRALSDHDPIVVDLLIE
ncbi:MAG TPA: endonuclease/exonuclease/phosphatase family protein [Blastocatellia bacterium]|nr:endonuclease/exonuclease/phosphatase family protein [Blastocatellia bacterium]